MTPSVPELVSYVSLFLLAYTAQYRLAKPPPTPCPTGHRSFSQVRWKTSIPTVKPSFPSNGGSRRRGSSLAEDSDSPQPLQVSKFPVSLPVRPAPPALARTSAESSDVQSAFIWPPKSALEEELPLHTRTGATQKDTQSEARFLRTKFSIIINSKRTIANNHCQRSHLLFYKHCCVSNPIRQC